MLDCFQFHGVDVLEHGRDVRSRYLELKSILLGVSDSFSSRWEWKIPIVLCEPEIVELIRQIDEEVAGHYQVYHDCGKPEARTVDEAGGQHFPDHARVSKERWLSLSDGSDRALAIGELIGMDMDAHILKAVGAEEFARRPQAVLLLLTALAEVHSNAVMFGGLDSIGFKIKYKALEKNCFRVFKAIVAQRQSRDL